MGDILSQVQRSRFMADELRAVAESLSNAIVQDTLLDMADGYDRLADDMEDLLVKKRERASVFRDAR